MDAEIKEELVENRLEALRLRLQKVMGDMAESVGASHKQQAKKMGLADSNLTKYTKSQSDKKPPVMGVDKLIRICEYYKVSSDYMLGLTSDKKLARRYDADDAIIKQMCDYSGLSRQAIEALHKKKDDFLFSAGLSYLLSSSNPLLSNIVEYILTCLHDVAANDKRYSRLPGISSATEEGKHFFYDVFEELPQAREHFYQLVTGNEAIRERYAQEMAFKCVDWKDVFCEVYPYLSYSPELSAEDCYKMNQKNEQEIEDSEYSDDYDPNEFFNLRYDEPDEDDPITIYRNRCERALEDLRIHLAEKNNAE